AQYRARRAIDLPLINRPEHSGGLGDCVARLEAARHLQPRLPAFVPDGVDDRGLRFPALFAVERDRPVAALPVNAVSTTRSYAGEVAGRIAVLGRTRISRRNEAFADTLQAGKMARGDVDEQAQAAISRGLDRNHARHYDRDADGIAAVDDSSFSSLLHRLADY